MTSPVSVITVSDMADTDYEIFMRIHEAQQVLDHGICSCGHPVKHHYVPRFIDPLPKGEEDTRTDQCQTNRKRGRRSKNDPYNVARPERLCRCTRVVPVLATGDLRYFSREASDPAMHPFNRGLGALRGAKPDRAVLEWYRAPTCRRRLPDGSLCGRTEGVQMAYMSPTQEASDWRCVEHTYHAHGVAVADAVIAARDTEISW